jgi:hypothetical protein
MFEYLADAVNGGVLELISPWTGAALAASVIAFYTSAHGLQLGPAVEVIAVTSIAANLTARGVVSTSRWPRPWCSRSHESRHRNRVSSRLPRKPP